MNNYQKLSKKETDLLDGLIDSLQISRKGRSSDIDDVVTRLRAAKLDVLRREQEEQKRRQEERLREQERILRQMEEEQERILRQKEQEQKQKEEEAILQATCMDLPMDWENLFAGDPSTEGVHADSPADGLILSQTNLGKVDIEYISAITGEEMKTVISTLKGAIYQNPDTWEECFYKGWETAEEYLSGNMVRKWQTAQEANEKYRGYFAENVKAIEDVLPPSISIKEIYITLGSPWVPADIIDEFIRHILNVKDCFCHTIHDPLTGSWEISDKSFYQNRVACKSTYGTHRLSALHILERTLNMKTVAVTDEVFCYTNKSNSKRVINQQETVAALEKQQKLIKEFQRWVWRNAERRNRLENIYENNYSCVRRRRYDGSFLTFPNMSPLVTLYPYQKDAVARILFSPNTLLAHDVGSGKTFTMIAAGMELRRMGLSKKNLYVVPNNLVGQWQEIFLRIYPQAKLFCVEPKNFTPEKRETTLRAVRDNDYDGIIMAYSCFEQIGLSKAYFIKQLEEASEEVKELLKKAERNTAKLRSKLKSINKQLFDVVTEALDNGGSIFFDELGITRLFVDEAHNFKNVDLDTKITGVLGISSRGSAKCQDMLHKVRMIQKLNNGGGVVMATGTPITNSITDVFVMQQYLQSGELALLDLQNFDSWVGMFAEQTTEFEIDVDTSSYRLATRFARFHNLPELTTLLSAIADFHQVDTYDDIPTTDGYCDVLIGKTEEFEEYLQEISNRAEDVRAGLVKRTEDNMLKITTDGRKAALDMRHLFPDLPFTYQCKAFRCVENVVSIRSKTMNKRSTQLIFCDSSTPKKGFNLYDEVRSWLIRLGVPETEIAYIHDATTERKRQQLFQKVQNGEVRVLIGSTFKLGLGVNVQNKLIAVHHLDVPWRPADMTQREGRILRQGNENKKVQIFRYITEGSFDAYSWQLLETKQRFIADLLAGSIETRSGSDIEDTVLNYAEVKALAVGNPKVKERVEMANHLSKLIALQRKAVENHIYLEKELTELPAKMERQKDLIAKCRRDEAFVAETGILEDKDQRRLFRKTIFDGVAGNELATQESLLMQYQGFDILLPANMSKAKPFIWLQREGRYYVELGDAEKGCLVRIDNVLLDLGERAAKLENGLEEMEQRTVALKEELTKTEDYTDQIAACKKKLKKLDQELGVDQE